jgi:hypothetical protein
MDEKKNNLPENLVSLDEAKMRRMKKHGNTYAMVEQFEILRLKLLYDKPMNPEEAHNLVLLTKYFIQNGPSEAFRLSCKLLYEKYMEPYNL